MVDESHIRSLLEEALNSGRRPEEVCAACPEHLEEVRSRWLRIRSLAGDLERAFPSTDRLPPRAGAGLFGPVRAIPRIPGHELEEEIGRGGMGVVYRARHVRLDRVVAVKMLRAGDFAGERELAGLVREAQAVAALEHPHIVQVHDVGELDGLPYFTMEFVEGGSLAQRLAGEPQPAMKAAEWISVLAHTVHAAHERGILHRDLKPGNVLVGADGTLKVTDFGLARRFGGDGDVTLTLGHGRVGTLSYMPPEQALGAAAALKPTADIYSLGAILYEMLTGRPPFRGESASETERQIVSDEPVPPSRLNPRTPRDLQTICLKCLQKSPERRYATARELGDDVDRFRRGEPIRARPIGRAERAVKWARRRPAHAALVGAGVVVVAAAFAGGIWYQGIVATRHAERAFRESQSRSEVTLALGQARAAIDAEEWNAADRALISARQRSEDARSPELDGEIASLAKAVRLGRALEETRQSRIAPASSTFDLAGVLRRYDADFRDAAIPVKTDPRASAAIIRTSPVRAQLLAALDCWASLAYDLNRLDECERLLAVAREADPGTGWRRRFREPGTWTDRDGVLALAVDASKLAGAPDGPAPHHVSLVGLRLGRVGAADVGTELLRGSTRARPDDFWMNWELGWSLMISGRMQEAIPPLRAAVAIRPQNAFACELLGRALYNTGDVDEGIEWSRRAQALAPESSSIRRTVVVELSGCGRWREAEIENAKWRTLDRDGVAARIMLLFRLRELGRHEDAVAMAREMLAVVPDEIDALRVMGVCLYDLNRLAEAEAPLRAWARLRPETAAAHAWLSRTLFYMGRVDGAIEAGKRAFECSFNVTGVVPRLGEALIARGRLAEAAELCEHLSGAAPSDRGLWQSLATAQMGQRRFAEAERSLERALALPAVEGERRALTRLRELCEQVSRIEAMEPELLEATRPWGDPALLLDVAEWNERCVGNHTLALAQFEAAFAAEPSLCVTSGSRARRYAACAALGVIQTASPGRLSPEGAQGLRSRAFAWLSAERDELVARGSAGGGPTQVAIADEFRSWVDEAALAGECTSGGAEPVRGESRWEQLWNDVERRARLHFPSDVLARARRSAATSDWVRACEHYRELFRLEPGQDGERWFELACVQALAGDLDGYRRTCDAMVEARASSPNIRGYHIARALTLAPGGAGALARATELSAAELSQAGESAWAITQTGALAYRSGHGSVAVTSLKRSLERDPRPGMAVLNWLWLALANVQTGSPGEASRWFDKADTWLGRMGDELPPSNGPSAIHLHNWLEAQILRREAGAAVGGAGRSG